MEWNTTNTQQQVGSSLRSFLAARPDNPSAILYNYNNYDLHQHPQPSTASLLGLDVKHDAEALEEPHAWLQAMEKDSHSQSHNNSGDTTAEPNYYSSSIQDKKKRLTCDQLESLERSFLDEIKLDPDRKMKLARDLGLHPRRIAVWFQNRRARWKNKQLERSYQALKQEYDVVFREKQKLQDEVAKLREVLRDQGVRNQLSTTGGCTDVSGDETIESAAAVVANRQRQQQIALVSGAAHLMGESSSFFQSGEDYNPLPVQTSYWQSAGAQLPPYP